MPDLPVMLKVAGRRCLVIGGGGVAVRRATSLAACGAEVTVIAPEVDHAIAELEVTIHRRPYQAGDLAGALLVVIATDNSAVNARVAADAAAAGVLVNRSDDPAAGDFAVPAHAHEGPVTIAVHTGGIAPAAGALIRRELSAALDADWARLLEIAAPYRALLQQQVADTTTRQRLMAQMTDGEALALYKREGAAALDEHCRRVCASAGTSAETGPGA